MSVSDMGYASAISEGNSLMRSVAEHNEGIRQNTQILTQQWNATLSRDADKKKEDQAVHGVEDAYGGMTALGTIGQGVSRIKQLGFGGALRADISNVKKQASSVYNYVKGTPSDTATQASQAGDASVAKPGEPASSTAPEPTEATEASSTPSANPAETSTEASVTETATESTGADVGNVARNVSEETASSGEELASKLMKGVKTAGKVGKIAGVAGGALSLGTGIANIADGDFKKMDTAHKVSSIWGDLSGALDIASVFIPVLAPAAAAVSIGSAIDSTVTDLADDKNQENTDQGDKQNQLNSNNKSMQIDPSYTSMSLVGNAQQNVKQQIAGSASF